MKHEARGASGTFISEIYAAQAGIGSWQAFLDRLAGILPNGKATLFYHDFASQTGAFSLNSGFEEDMIAAYTQHYARQNPWMPKAFIRPIGMGVRADQMAPQKQVLQTEFYADFLRPQGLFSGAGVTIFRDQGRNFMLSVLSGPASDAELNSAASLLSALAPHLGQVFNYYRRASAAGTGHPIVGAAADALDAAIFAIGIGRHLCWTNSHGRAMLSCGDPIGVDVRDRVTAPSSSVREAIDVALDAAMRGESASKRTLTVPSQNIDGGARRLTIVIPALPGFERYFGGPCILIIVDETRPRQLPTEAALRLAFALTPAEAKLALAIAKGAPLNEAAAGLRISKGTVRNQLKSIFAKMDIRRQAELVVKIHRL